MRTAMTTQRATATNLTRKPRQLFCQRLRGCDGLAWLLPETRIPTFPPRIGIFATVTPVERSGTTVYELRLDPSDVGRIIGKQGVTINAIRSLLLAGSAKQGLRCSLEIIEDRPAP